MLFNPHYFNYFYIYMHIHIYTINLRRKLLLSLRCLDYLLYHNISQSLHLHWFLIFTQNHHCEKII